MPQVPPSAARADPDALQRYWADWLELTLHVEVYERVAERVSARWGRLLAGSALLTAICGTGSGVAGWALWSTSPGKTVWALIAGTTTLTSVVATALGFATKSEWYAQAFGKLNVLRRQLHSFQSSSLRRAVPIDDKMQDKLDAFQKEWDSTPAFRSDLFNTERLRTAVQLAVESEYQDKGWLA